MAAGEAAPLGRTLRGMQNASAFVSGLSEAQTSALVEIMFLAAKADGEFTDDERAEFTVGIESMTEKKLSAAQVDAYLAHAEEALETSDRETRLGAVKEAFPAPASRRLALAMAIRVVAADGIIRTSERELILEAAEALGIDGNVAADLVRDLGKV
jgi:uncharacterized membrane protein YebE (DUF533 family)